MVSGIASPDPSDRVGPNHPASRAIAEAFSTAVSRLQEAHERARAGDPLGVRRLRTTARRLRSQLRAFRALIDREWSDRLNAELRWLGATLGEPRDLDVLHARLRTEVPEEDRAALKPLFDWLDQRRAKAGKAVDRTLKGRRFRELMAELERSAAEPRTTRKAAGTCREVLPPLVARAWRRLRRDTRGLTRESLDSDFHEVRNRAKRARHATERIAPTLGRKAARRGARLVRFAQEIQDVLGAHQDAVVAAAAVEARLARKGLDNAFRDAAASLLSRLRLDADKSRDSFLKEHLPKLDKRKNRGELKAGE